MQVVGYINTNKDCLHGQVMEYLKVHYELHSTRYQRQDRNQMLRSVPRLTAHVYGEIEGLAPLCFCGRHQIDNSSEIYLKTWIGAFTEHRINLGNTPCRLSKQFIQTFTNPF